MLLCNNALVPIQTYFEGWKCVLLNSIPTKLSSAQQMSHAFTVEAGKQKGPPGISLPIVIPMTGKMAIHLAVGAYTELQGKHYQTLGVGINQMPFTQT